jgi:hypothetical protein
MLRWIASLNLSLLGIFGAIAQSDLMDTSQITKVFTGICAQNISQISKIHATARFLGWQEITDPDTRKMLAPLDPNVKFILWAAKEEEKLFLVSAGSGVVDKQELNNCTIGVRTQDVQHTYAVLESALGLKRINYFENAGSKYNVYELNSINGVFRLYTVHSPLVDKNLAVITVMTDLKKAP